MLIIHHTIFYDIRIKFSPNRPTGPIRSSSRDVRLCICVSVPFPCNFFKVMKSKVFRCGLWLFYNNNSQRSGSSPLCIIIQSYITYCLIIKLNLIEVVQYSCTLLDQASSTCTKLQGSVKHCNHLHCTSLHCTALYCTALHSTVLHVTAVH